MALFESYTINDNTQGSLSNTNWGAMMFTPSASHTIEKVALKLYKTSTPGTVTVSIQGVDGSNLPDGIDLASGTIDGNALGGSPGAFVDIIMGTNPELAASTKYAIVVRSAAGTLNWRIDIAGGSYDGGNRGYSSNSGVDWADGNSDQDYLFEEHGTAAGGGGGSGGGMKMTIRI